MTPASLAVVSNLAQDSVIAGVMDVAAGVNKVALFANPFVGGAEEMLYVDEQATLRWARHLNAPAGLATEGSDEVSGWSVAPLLDSVVEVVVAVHPRGGVFAWVLHGDEVARHLSSFALVADPSVPEGFRWEQGLVWLPDMDLSGLSVQYCADRPATPVVFVTDPSEPRLLWFMANYGPDSQGAWWHRGGEFAYDPADRGVSVVAGIDDPSESEQPTSVVRVVRVWTTSSDGLWLTTYLPRSPQQPYLRQRVLQGEGIELTGRWVHPYGAGVIAHMMAGRRVMAVTPSPGSPVAQTFVLDQPLEDVQVWQDAENLLHLYGRDAKARLNAVHQTGWEQDPDLTMRWGIPVWDTHTDPHGQPVLTTRPLVAQMATYAIDPFPDELPSQHVMHQDVEPAEACAIYTQSTRTNFWSVEKVRLVPTSLPAAYTVARYQTKLTLTNGLGAPMPGVPISLTADVPVDLEVAGRFYRTGSITPTTLVTDATGQITLRVVARGLNVPLMYATTPAMAQSVTVQMAAEVHKFLAGDAALPNHRDGFTPTTVQDATQPDGTTPLFPHLRPDAAAGTWPPSAADVVTWCQAAFAVDAGTPLPTQMQTGLADGDQIQAFTLQTHDPDRPGFEVYTSPTQLAARRTAIEAKGGIFDPAEDWWGDVWQGIREGVNQVAEVLVNLVDSTIELAITLADGIITYLTAAWDDILTAAHAVEAVFVAIGAAIDDAITWLKWAFDFTDVIAYAHHITTQIRQVPALALPLIDDFEPRLHQFFTDQEATVHQALTDLKADILPNRTTGSLQTPTAGIPTDLDPAATTPATDQALGPHANWLTDKLTTTSSSGAPGVAGIELALDPALRARVDSLADEFLKILTDAAAGSHLEAALTDFGNLFTNLFNAQDPHTAIALELTTLFDLFDHLTQAGLTFLDNASHQALEWLRRALEAFLELLDTPITGVPLLDVIWDYLLADANLTTTDFPLTLANLGAIAIAFPTTVIFKMITGTPPIEHLTSAHSGPINEIFLGISEIIEIPLRTVISYAAHQPYVNPCFIGFLILRTYRSAAEFPLLYGFESPPRSRQAVAAYVSWTLDLVWNVAEFAVYLHGDQLLECYFPRNPVGPSPEPAIIAASAASSAFGLAQLVAAIITWWPDNLNYYTTLRLSGRVARRLSETTVFIRQLWRMNQLAPPYIAAMWVKVLSDVVDHAFTGISQVVFASIELNNPSVIQGDQTLTPAVVGTSFTSAEITVTGGLPSYHWQSLDELPPGLSLITHTGTFDYGDSVTLKGVPTRAGDYQFRLQVTDSYAREPAPSEKRFSITIYGVPVASFAPSVDDGFAPLEVQFHDTSTGSPMTWAWDLGDGDKSGTQNPVHTYAKPGTYHVTLTVTNPAGTSTSPPTQIVVEPPPE